MYSRATFAVAKYESSWLNAEMLANTEIKTTASTKMNTKTIFETSNDTENTELFTMRSLHFESVDPAG